MGPGQLPSAPVLRCQLHVPSPGCCCRTVAAWKSVFIFIPSSPFVGPVQEEACTKVREIIQKEISNFADRQGVWLVSAGAAYLKTRG